MILYNFKYRGPYEYEKFILNIYQFLNEMKDLRDTVEQETSSGIAAISDKFKQQIDNLLDIDLQLAYIRERKPIA